MCKNVYTHVCTSVYIYTHTYESRLGESDQCCVNMCMYIQMYLHT